MKKMINFVCNKKIECGVVYKCEVLCRKRHIGDAMLII